MLQPVARDHRSRLGIILCGGQDALFLLRSGVAVKNSSFGENRQTRVSVFFSILLRIKCDLQTKCVKKNINTVFSS